MIGSASNWLGWAALVAGICSLPVSAYGQQKPTAQADAPPPLSTEDRQQMIMGLRSGDASKVKAALQDVHALDPDQLSLNATQILPAVLDAKAYTDAEDLALSAILARPNDVAEIELAQHIRAQAFFAQGDYPNALAQAREYYNVCTLAKTNEAIHLVNEALEKSGKTAEADRFETEQASTDASPATQPAQVQMKDSATTAPQSVLQSIDVDTDPFAAGVRTLQKRKGSKGYSFASLMGQGNLLLLADQPADAKTAFEEACKVATRNAKQLREGVEGVARALRAQSENSASANAFILSLRERNEDASAALKGEASTVSSDDFAAAARQTKLANESP